MNLHYFVGVLIAIFFTSLSYFLSDKTLHKRLRWWQSLIIGVIVVVAGAVADLLHAPMGIIIALPFVIGITLLYVFFKGKWKFWIFTYLLTWVYYTVLHVILSWGFRFDSLIPAWKLHS